MTAMDTTMTTKQREYMESLARDCGWYQPELNALTQATHGVDYLALSKTQASATIKRLLELKQETR